MIWPFRRKKAKRPAGHVALAHLVSHWRYEGTGYGDDREGVKCTCGWWAVGGARAAHEHQVKAHAVEDLNP